MVLTFSKCFSIGGQSTLLLLSSENKPLPTPYSIACSGHGPDLIGTLVDFNLLQRGGHWKENRKQRRFNVVAGILKVEAEVE